MKIAVTGASGYIGRHVVSALSTISDVEVIAGVRDAGRANDLPACVSVIPLDLANGQDAFDRLGRPDSIVHLAWGGLPNYLSTHHFDGELPMQYRFIEGLVSQGLSSLVVAGTCYEYGMLSGPLTEDREAVPTNPYGFAKATLRGQLRFLQRSRPFDLAWARLFYSYGNGQAPSSIFASLQSAMARGDAKFPMSQGEQLRDFMPIEEMAKALAMLATRTPDGEFNICSGEPISVRRLVEQWVAEAGSEITLELGRFPYPDYEPLAFWGSREKLDRLWALE